MDRCQAIRHLIERHSNGNIQLSRAGLKCRGRACCFGAPVSTTTHRATARDADCSGAQDSSSRTTSKNPWQLRSAVYEPHASMIIRMGFGPIPCAWVLRKEKQQNHILNSIHRTLQLLLLLYSSFSSPSSAIFSSFFFPILQKLLQKASENRPRIKTMN